MGAEDRLQMEQVAAILTQLGVHKLQKGAQTHAKAFCGAFGIAQTADIEQLITDPAMMDSTQQAEVQRRLKDAFELKRSIAMVSGGVETPKAEGTCHGGFGEGYWDLQQPTYILWALW